MSEMRPSSPDLEYHSPVLPGPSGVGDERTVESSALSRIMASGARGRSASMLSTTEKEKIIIDRRIKDPPVFKYFGETKMKVPMNAKSNYR